VKVYVRASGSGWVRVRHEKNMRLKVHERPLEVCPEEVSLIIVSRYTNCVCYTVYHLTSMYVYVCVCVCVGVSLSLFISLVVVVTLSVCCSVLCGVLQCVRCVVVFCACVVVSCSNTACLNLS